MKSFLDSSVLVASFYDHHFHHDRSFELLSRQNRTTGATAAHCLAEAYSVLTRMPGRERTSPQDALLFLNDIRERLMLVTLDEGDYGDVLSDAAEQGISGGSIYDALIARCALKAKAQTIYTWNTRHFTRLGPQIASRVKEP